ncbi:hypothetical protein [Dietzia massiliensis]|uniref:hypothetical protein n=1 Tax=Dietzia massiliensis TaxID=2697499 RepID=UPI001F1B2D72|nr:hypothetical protein [Dietzia massiliensis]
MTGEHGHAHTGTGHAQLGQAEDLARLVAQLLLLARHLQDVTGMSIKKIVTTLQPLRTVTVAIGDHEMLVEATIPDAARAVIDAINAE